jgi:predicted transcriptional regulator
VAYGKVEVMEKTTVYLPVDLQRALHDEGRRTRRAQADLIREAIGAYLAKRPRRIPRSVGIAADGKVSGRRSEPWIEREWSRR